MPRSLHPLAPAAIALAAIALVVAACVPTAGPEWTYAPPTVPPTPQAVASGAASGAPSGGAEGSVVQISTAGTTYEQTEVSAPAGVRFVIHFNNRDTGVLHDISIRDASGVEVFRGDPVMGQGEVDYQVPALAAGTYQFVCTIHPGMAGMLMAGG